MSIKKKPITTTTNNISRKKLFKFLFKSYIKSAYSGISHIPTSTSATSVINNNHPLHHHYHQHHRHLNCGNELRREYYNDMNECSNIIKLNKKKQRQQQSTTSNSDTSTILPMKFVHIPKIPANARPGQSVDADSNMEDSKMIR